jgi:glycine/D-amino acid oxidase-like deaminating enzyme
VACRKKVDTSIIEPGIEMSKMVDHLIIGQGLCGTLLSSELRQAGRSVVVIDDADPASSTRVAGGIVNPVTGMRMVESWMIDDLLPAAREKYLTLERELKVGILHETEILEFHLTKEQRDLFHERKAASAYLQDETEIVGYEPYFRFYHGVGKIAPALLVDLMAMLDAWREELKAAGCLITERFERTACEIGPDGVRYKRIEAATIIFCDGVGGMNDPYFGRLPWSTDKGEALLVSIPGLPRGIIYKQGIAIVPWRDDLFWVGASHDWRTSDLQPTAMFRDKVCAQLDQWLKLPYTVMEHLVSSRPGNVERRPFVGMHPLHSNLGIFNGMGGKGISTAPYFARQFAMHLSAGAPLDPAVDIKRFTRILTK